MNACITGHTVTYIEPRHYGDRYFFGKNKDRTDGSYTWGISHEALMGNPYNMAGLKHLGRAGPHSYGFPSTSHY